MRYRSSTPLKLCFGRRRHDSLVLLCKKEKARLISQSSLYLCRQLPTLPHSSPCSTIGPAGLNFRVRDGNGWNPRGKITARSAFSTQPSAFSQIERVERFKFVIARRESGSTSCWIRAKGHFT